jgi:hypothetical protein
MKQVSSERRLSFIKQDVARLLENLTNDVLDLPIDGFENLKTVLNNIAIASDIDDEEPSHWISTWYEVYMFDEEGTETIAEFDTKKQAIDFMYNYSLKNPDIQLSYDEWESNAQGEQVFKRNRIN